MGDEGKTSLRCYPAHARRTAAVVVADPRIVVVESANMASPAALDDALELLVKWAVRARMRGESTTVGAPIDKKGATYGRED